MCLKNLKNQMKMMMNNKNFPVFSVQGNFSVIERIIKLSGSVVSALISTA